VSAHLLSNVYTVGVLAFCAWAYVGLWRLWFDYYRRQRRRPYPRMTDSWVSGVALALPVLGAIGGWLA
jgi:DNA-directed RNA polymerase specialized sigma24 family protein